MCFYDYNEVLFDSKRLKVLKIYIDLNRLKMEARKIYIFFFVFWVIWLYRCVDWYHVIKA